MSTVKNFMGGGTGQVANIYIDGIDSSASVSCVTPTGATKNAIWGSRVVEGVTVNCWQLPNLTEFGSYVISATKGSLSASATCLVDVVTNYTVEMSRLPNTYQEVEWIASTDGAAYINTGYTIPTSGYRAVGSLLHFVGTQMSWATVLGTFSSASNAGKFGKYSSSDSWSATFGGDTSGGTLSTDVDYTFDVSFISGNKYLKINGSDVITSSNTSSLYAYPVFLFTYNRGGSPYYEFMYGRLGEVKLYSDADSLVRDMIPCYRISDGVIGMYCLVTNTFYINAGSSGTFTKGDDVWA